MVRVCSNWTFILLCIFCSIGSVAPSIQSCGTLPQVTMLNSILGTHVNDIPALARAVWLEYVPTGHLFCSAYSVPLGQQCPSIQSCGTMIPVTLPSSYGSQQVPEGQTLQAPWPSSGWQDPASKLLHYKDNIVFIVVQRFQSI